MSTTRRSKRPDNSEHVKSTTSSSYSSTSDAPHPARNPLPFLLLLPLLSRLLTFTLNQLLLRHLTPKTLGLSLQLDLLLSSILYFSRESLRCALLRSGDTEDDRKKAVNLSFGVIPLGVGFAGILGGMYMLRSKGLLESEPTLGPAVGITLIAALLELLSEPLFLTTQLTSQFGLRARAEALGTIVRAATLYALISFTSLHLRAFPLSHLFYSLTLLLTYALPLSYPCPGRSYSRTQAKLALTMWTQSFLRYLLSQADALLLTLFAPPSVQGTFGFAANYGALIARLGFAPVEESCRAVFSRSGASAQKEAGDMLAVILRVYALLSLVFACLAPPLTPRLIRIIASGAFSTGDTAAVLSAYCYYIPLLAYNGVLEAYVQSRASPAELGKQSGMLVASSVGMFAVGVGVLKGGYGAVGLIGVNGAVMAARISWCVGFMKKGSKVDWRKGFPSVGTIGALGVAGSLFRLRGGRSTLVEEAAVVAAAGLVALWSERKFLVECWRVFKGDVKGEGLEDKKIK